MQPIPQGHQTTYFQIYDSFLFHYSYYQISQIILNSQHSHNIPKSSFISIYFNALKSFFPQNTMPENTVIISHSSIHRFSLIQFLPSVHENLWKTYPSFSPYFSNMLLITSICFLGIWCTMIYDLACVFFQMALRICEDYTIHKVCLLWAY